MNKLIIDTLSTIGLPVAYQHYTDDKPSFIRFSYLPQDDDSADDDEFRTTHYVQVDYFTPGNTQSVRKQIKELMKKAGFKKNFEHEVYETDTKLFHVILRFYIIKEE